MAKTIDLQLIQNSSGNFVVYDDTNRAYDPNNEFISYSELAGAGAIITMTLTDTNGVVQVIEIQHKLGAVPTDSTSTPYEFDFTTMGDQRAFEFVISEVGKPTSKLWNISYRADYVDSGTSGLVVGTQITYDEFVYFDLEVYRATRFEELAKCKELYLNIGTRVRTPTEVNFEGLRKFDIYFLSLRAALEVGNIQAANTIHQWLTDFTNLNPIT